jgi:lysozyme family protein
MSTAALVAANAARWSKAKLTRAAEFGPVAARLAAIVAKARYQTIAARTGVPWFVIAVIHEREASQRWDRGLAQGDPWASVSTHAPKGRGPFASFEAAAVDALTNCAPYAARWTDWSPGGAMTLLEQYNGLGYANRGLPSPYVWSGTDQYTKGKYIADGVFNANVVDAQLGCAGLIMTMQTIDPSIVFRSATPSPADASPAADAAATPAIVLAAKPSITHPAPGSLGAWVASFFTARKPQ